MTASGSVRVLSVNSRRLLPTATKSAPATSRNSRKLSARLGRCHCFRLVLSRQQAAVSVDPARLRIWDAMRGARDAIPDAELVRRVAACHHRRMAPSSTCGRAPHLTPSRASGIWSSVTLSSAPRCCCTEARGVSRARGCAASSFAE
jgi:hypothetical protein